MTSSNGIVKWIVIGGAAALAVTLYLLPHNPLANAEEPSAPTTAAEHDLSTDLSEARNGMDSIELAKVDRLSQSGKVDSVLTIYGMLRQPAAAAFIAAQRADKEPTAVNLSDAGERYLLCARYLGSDVQRKAWFAKAKELLTKAVAADPTNLDYKVSLGVCLVEGATLTGEAPMQGIGILKEVEQIDPDHAGALLNLGYFSIQSGQYDKAEERFNRVVQKHPEMADAHLYLADLHERTENYVEAINDLKNYMNLVTDPQKIAEVNAYINNLQTKIKQ